MKSKADKALLDWLEEHYDDVMRWKEYLNHEGTGKRAREEWQEVQKLYGKEQKRLILKQARLCLFTIFYLLLVKNKHKQSKASFRKAHFSYLFSFIQF